ncbi:ADM_collapsed_G0014370.mRNA.1.CDS.1 [Saccharomyces cerevisiae]|nr:ADM_collapsed_G0014370.mRNA.1.CDS.1 [Saccharomyces cerevisiae]
MMPAKLQLDVLRTLAVQRLVMERKRLKNSNFLERFHKDRIVFCLPFFPALFSSQFKSTAAPLSSIHASCSILYNTTPLICLPDMRKTWLPLLASCRIQYTNCFSSSSNGQVPSRISLYLRVDLSLLR